MSTKKEAAQKAASHDDRFTHAAKLLDEVASVLALSSPGAQTAKQRRQVARARKGAEKAIPVIAALAAKYGFDLPLQPTAEMSSSLELAKQLEPLRQQLSALLALVEETETNAKGTSWTTATTLYGLLRRTAHRDSQLESRLAPVAEYFTIRHPAKKGSTPAKGKKNGNDAKATGQSPEPTVAEPAPASPSASSGSGSNANAANGAASSSVTHA